MLAAQPAAFFGQRTCITPCTYVYTSFINDLILVKSVVLPKRLGKLYCSIACCNGVYCVGTLLSLRNLV